MGIVEFAMLRHGYSKKKKKRTELGARLALPAGEERRRRRRRRELGARLALPAGEERRRRRRPRRRSRRE